MQSKVPERILIYLKNKKGPLTTDRIAKKLKVSWNTAQVHLLKLAVDGKIQFRKVGRQNEFFLAKRGTHA
jgi:predicted ArsR family transcriptional regulator